MGVNWSDNTPIVAGNVTPSDADANPSNNVPTSAYQMAWDVAAGKWIRRGIYAANADGNSAANTKGTISLSLGYVFNGTTWDRVRSSTVGTGGLLVGGNVTPSDTQGNPSNSQHTSSLLSGWSPGNLQWRRLVGGQTGADAIAATNNILYTASEMFIFNGSTWDRWRGDTTYGADVDVTRTNSDVTYHGNTSVGVSYGSRQSYHVHLDAQAIAATTGFMLIDLSDTTNWPHTATGHIFLDLVCLNTNPSTAFVGDIEFGFLSNVDATDGDFHVIHTIHYGQQGGEANPCLDYKGLGYDLQADDWFGPTTANDVTFQTDVNLQGPDGATSYPSGAGDFVMKVTVSTGAIDLGITISYDTVA